MTKNLVKIITICVLAVIIPVAIIVTAICLSNAVTYSLTLAIEGFENAGNITFRVNGQVYEDTLRISRNKEVTVTVSATGYKFNGWYNGDVADVSEETFIGDETSYVVKVSEDIKLTASFDIYEYVVTYDGNAENNETLKYGDDLNDGSFAVISEEDAKKGYTFDGWTLAGNSKVYDKAEFGVNREVSLTSKTKVVKENISYNITYKNADGDVIGIGDEVAYGENLNDGSFDENVDKENGKVFLGWKFGDEVLTKAEFDVNQDVELVSVIGDLYESSYKFVIVNIDFFDAGWKYENGSEIGAVNYTFDNRVEEDTNELTYNFDEYLVLTMLNKVKFDVVYKGEDAYRVSGLTVFNIGDTNDFDLETATISDLIDAYNRMGEEPFESGDTINIKLEYAQVA